MDITRVQDLCEVLEGHLSRYQTLVDYIAQEKVYLLNLDMDALAASSKVKEALAIDIQQNIQELIERIKEVALMLGLPLEPQPLLVDLVPHMPKPFDNKLNDASVKLDRLKNMILRENEANRRYIEEALRLIGESVDILTGATQLRGDGYQKDGTVGENRKGLPVKLSREV